MPLTLTSSAFSHGGPIPKAYTCQGQDISPPLSWDGVIGGVQSFVLIVDDPDAPDPAAPKRVYVHWVLYDIPPDARELLEGITAESLPPGAREGKNDWDRVGYGGPCPSIGRHRYYFKLYALDVSLGDLHTPTKSKVLDAMEGHILAETELVGLYAKT
jgi:Raf kinase inhibitor-like YbhB/YbcL family protein